MGASLVARSFSGDKEQLVPILKAGLMHRGFALIDVISPCVTYNDHVGSTKSYLHTREHKQEAVYADYVPPLSEVKVNYSAGSSIEVDLHEGGKVILTKVARDYSPIDRNAVLRGIRESSEKGEILTGLLYIDESQADFIENENTIETPINQLAFEDLCPGSEELLKLQKNYQ
jgi:2-oxoglutarate ferredoxin oxidoreductase subunit beta